jgi:[acyl-carrier-protein] S-malonyltransferase
MSKREKIAFLFPGQGHIPTVPPPTSEVGERLFKLAESSGVHLQEWLEKKCFDLLSVTAHAQPAIFIDSLAKAEGLCAKGLKPALVAGHSLGEYAAFATAGLFSPDDALPVVIKRGELMSHVNGAMAAIVKLPLEQVAAICKPLAPHVVIANYNSPMQAVISGGQDALRTAMKTAERAGGRAIPLHVGGPFHSPLMAEAQATLAPMIKNLSFASPSILVVSSVSGQVECRASTLKNLLLTQITACVRWIDVVENLIKEDVTVAIEVGPGNALTSLGKRITSCIQFLEFEEAWHG